MIRILNSAKLYIILKKLNVKFELLCIFWYKTFFFPLQNNWISFKPILAYWKHGLKYYMYLESKQLKYHWRWEKWSIFVEISVPSSKVPTLTRIMPNIWIEKKKTCNFSTKWLFFVYFLKNYCRLEVHTILWITHT